MKRLSEIILAAISIAFIVFAVYIPVYAGSSIIDGTSTVKSNIIIDGVAQGFTPESEGEGQGEGEGEGEGSSEGEWAGCPEGEVEFCTFALLGDGGSGSGSVCLAGGGDGPPTAMTVHVEYSVDNVVACIVIATWPDGLSVEDAVILIGTGTSESTHTMSESEVAVFSHDHMNVNVYVLSTAYPMGACYAEKICSGG